MALKSALNIFVTVDRALWDVESYITTQRLVFLIPKSSDSLAFIDSFTKTFKTSLSEDLFKVVLTSILIAFSRSILC